jgi:hypothetical protein
MGRENDWRGERHRLFEVPSVSGRADFSGYINLPRHFPSLGDTQFEILCILAPVSLVITVIITCITIQEVDPALLFTLPGQETENKGGIQSALHVVLS